MWAAQLGLSVVEDSANRVVLNPEWRFAIIALQRRIEEDMNVER
jgi:hypothetical protein